MRFLQIFLSLAGVPLLSGAGGVLLFGRRSGRACIQGLLFHSLYSERFRPSMSSVRHSLFESILRRLKNECFETMTVTRAFAEPDRLQGRKTVLLTFDDGCRSICTHALPLMETLPFKATVFPVAGYTGKRSTWDVLPSFLHLSKSEIRELHDCGHEIGSHGMNHEDLTLLDDRTLAAELTDSKKVLEDITGSQVTSLSFPFGSWNRRVWERAREAGYRCGTVCRKHRCAPPDLFPVYGVYNFDSSSSVLSRLSQNGRFYSVSRALAAMMSHFAKGAPMWKFSRKYSIGRKTHFSA